MGFEHESSEMEDPPPLPPRHSNTNLSESPTDHEASLRSFLPFGRNLQRGTPSVQQEQSLYICRVPGSQDVFLTEHKIKSTIVTNFDVNAGSYLLHYEDAATYATSLNLYEPDTRPKATDIPRKSVHSIRRKPSRSPALDSTFSSNSSNDDRPSSSHSLFKLEPIAPAELRNNSQLPLYARSVLPQDAAPQTLIRLDPHGSDHTSVTRMLSIPCVPTGNGDPERTSAVQDDPALATSDSIFIDMLDESYDHYGMDINYVEPSNEKCFTRRMLKTKEMFNNNWFLLSPTHGYFVFESNIFRDAVVCYHYLPKPPRMPMDEKVQVSRLTFNLVHHKQPTSQLRSARVSQSGSSTTDLPSSNASSRLTSLEDPLDDRTAIPQRRRAATDTRQRVQEDLQNLRDSMSSSLRSAFTTQESDTTILRAGASRRSILWPRNMKKQFSASMDEYSHRDRLSQSSGHHSENSMTSGFGGTRRQTMSEDVDQYSQVDLRMGREKLGGGIAGEEAKLGKVVVFGEGIEFRDLLVAANLALFNRAYRRTSA